MIKLLLLLSFYVSLAVSGFAQSSRSLQQSSLSNSRKNADSLALFESLFNLLSFEDKRQSISRFVDGDLGIQRNLLSFFSDKFFSSNSSDKNKRTLERRVAECTLTYEDKNGVVAQTLYLPLKDAEDYAKRMENASEGTPGIKFFNKADDKSDVDSTKKVDFKCKTIILDDDTKKCSTCVYAEVLVPKSHIRYGYFGSATILECINGYDNNLGSSERPYFVQETPNYYPICIA